MAMLNSLLDRLKDVFTDVNGMTAVRTIGDVENCIKIDSADPASQYVGTNSSISAADTASNWVVYNITPTVIKRTIGAWQDRGSLF